MVLLFAWLGFLSVSPNDRWVWQMADVMADRSEPKLVKVVILHPVQCMKQVFQNSHWSWGQESLLIGLQQLLLCAVSWLCNVRLHYTILGARFVSFLPSLLHNAKSGQRSTAIFLVCCWQNVRGGWAPWCQGSPFRREQALCGMPVYHWDRGSRHIMIYYNCNFHSI